MTSFRIRPATLAAGDEEHFADFWDSQLPWLAAVGSDTQWAMKSVRERYPRMLDKTRDQIRRSEQGPAQPWNSTWCRTFIAEVGPPSPGREVPGVVPNRTEGVGSVPVAAMVLQGSSDFPPSLLPEQDPDDPFVYLSYLMSNRDAGDLSKGAGARLISFARDLVRDLGLHRLCADCWSGNDRRLVKFYEKQGFKAIGDFVVSSDNDWPGTTLEMRI